MPRLSMAVPVVRAATAPYPVLVLVRLLLTLLLAAFALPAMTVAPCHDGGSAAMAGMAMPEYAPASPGRDHPVRHHQAVPAHACIGCVPPSTWPRSPAERTRIAQAPPTAQRIARLDLAPAAPPATPPPRREA